MTQIDILRSQSNDGIYIHPTALIYPNVMIGKNVYIGPFCIIGYPAEKKGKEIAGKVVIQSGTVIHGMCTIDSGTSSDTIIKENCYIMKQTHIGHDAVIGNNVTISPGSRIGGHAEIGDYCNIGMNATIHQRTIIPEGCMIGMNTTMIKGEYKSFRKYVGVARDIGSNANRHTDDKE